MENGSKALDIYVLDFYIPFWSFKMGLLIGIRRWEKKEVVTRCARRLQHRPTQSAIALP